MAARAGAELVDAAEARVERLVVGEGREAAVADGLVAVELNLIRLLHGAGADVVDAQRAARAQLVLDAQTPSRKYGVFSVPLGKVLRLTRVAWRIGAEGGLEGLVRLSGRVYGAAGDSLCDADAADLTVDSADEDGRVGWVGCAEVGDLRGDDVVEDAAARMQGYRI